MQQKTGTRCGNQDAGAEPRPDVLRSVQSTRRPHRHDMCSMTSQRSESAINAFNMSHGLCPFIPTPRQGYELS